jgi:hypothetical protein
MIYSAYKKTEIAFRYYLKKWPERDYSKDEARKQFAQDMNIDRKLLKTVYDEVNRDAKQELKTNP